MAIPNNYIDKITKDGDSRDICPAADKVRVSNKNFEGTDLDEVLDEVAEAIEDAGEGGYAPPQGGIPKTDLAPAVQTSLGLADTALQQSDLDGYATTDDVDDAVAALVDSSPTTLDTLNELAQALGDDPNFATTMATQLGGKVDKETGKGLSSNDYTTAEKTKLAGIAAGAEANVQSDWNQSDSTADDFIKNKPTIPTVPQNIVQSVSINGGTAETPDQDGNVDLDVQGTAGQDGITPHIGSNGNWWLGPETDANNDTGVKAQGPQGSVSITDGDLDTLVIANTPSGEGDVLGMGGARIIKNNVDSLYASLNRLYSKLANMAFWDSTDQADAEPTALDWSVPKVTVTLDKTAFSANAIITDASDNEITGTSVRVDQGGTLILKIKPATGYAIISASASVGGTPIVLDESAGVYILTIDNVSSTITIVLTVTTDSAYGISYNLTNCSASTRPTSIASGGTATIVLTASEGYMMPSTSSAITIANATITSYTRSQDKLSATLVIGNATDDVTLGLTAPIEHPYDGDLVFWLDGKDNLVDNKWVDKIGGIQFSGSGYTRVNDGGGDPLGFKFLKASNAYMQANTEPSFDPDTHTIEVVCKPIQESEYGAIHMFMPKTDGTATIGCIWKTSNKICGLTGDEKKTWTYTVVKNANLCIGQNINNAVANGSQLVSSSYDITAHIRDYSLGRNVNAQGAPFYSSVEVYAVRIYSGLLTPAQMLANQKVDNERYGLGLTLPNSI